MNATACRGCERLGDICPACESRAELRAAGSDEVERPDAQGRDADWHFPRGYGGLS